MQWDDARIFLAVAESGTLTRAARRLGLSQPTVGRRLAALEDDLRTRLFDRTGQRLLLTRDGEAVLEPARRMALEAVSMERRAAGRDAALSGTLRLSLTEGLGANWLPERLLAFRRRHPGIVVELALDNNALNLSRREADVALRLVSPAGRGTPAQDSLLIRRLGRLTLGLYASAAYLAERGAPASLDDLGAHDVVTADAAMALPHLAWFADAARRGRTALRTDSLPAHLAAARAGWGIALLAKPLGDAAPELHRVLPQAPTPQLDINLVWHADLKGVARVRALLDFMAELMKRERAALAD